MAAHGKSLLFVALGLLAIWFAAFWLRYTRGRDWRPTPFHLLIGAVTDFFDTLGIGSFATTTPLFKFCRWCRTS